METVRFELNILLLLWECYRIKEDTLLGFVSYEKKLGQAIFKSAADVLLRNNELLEIAGFVEKTTITKGGR